jgi:hypothetical protein
VVFKYQDEEEEEKRLTESFTSLTAPQRRSLCAWIEGLLYFEVSTIAMKEHGSDDGEDEESENKLLSNAELLFSSHCSLELSNHVLLTLPENFNTSGESEFSLPTLIDNTEWSDEGNNNNNNTNNDNMSSTHVLKQSGISIPRAVEDGQGSSGNMEDSGKPESLDNGLNPLDNDNDNTVLTAAKVMTPILYEVNVSRSADELLFKVEQVMDDASIATHVHDSAAAVGSGESSSSSRKITQEVYEVAACFNDWVHILYGQLEELDQEEVVALSQELINSFVIVYDRFNTARLVFNVNNNENIRILFEFDALEKVETENPSSSSSSSSDGKQDDNTESEQLNVVVKVKVNSDELWVIATNMTTDEVFLARLPGYVWRDWFNGKSSDPTDEGNDALDVMMLPSAPIGSALIIVNPSTEEEDGNVMDSLSLSHLSVLQDRICESLRIIPSINLEEVD